MSDPPQERGFSSQLPAIKIASQNNESPLVSDLTCHPLPLVFGLLRSLS